MQFGEKVYLACDETNWLIMTETENQEKGLKLEMAMGGVWQGWDPWFEPIRRQFFEVNVKSNPENELCGRHKYIQWMSSSSSKIEQFINKLLINYNVSKIAPVFYINMSFKTLKSLWENAVY
jgi:hypothetical protein